TGLIVLERIRNYVPSDRLLILDAKRGDIGTSAQAYARAAFDVIGADAVTVNPLMGHDAVAPFLARDGRGAFLLTRTSNPGAADLDQEGAGLLINVGRGIANAPEGYAGAAAALRDRIETARMAVRAGWRG